MIYGYVRVSTKSQKMERQIQNIIKFNSEAKIVKEKYTGTTTDRPVFQKLLKQINEGDTIIFDSVSRMSRNAEEGFELYKELFEKGINLVFLKEPYINTEVFKATLQTKIPTTGTEVDIILNAVNEYLMKLAEQQIQIAFNQAEKEVKDIQQRVKEGIREAKNQAEAEGKQFNIGRPVGTKAPKVNVKEIKAKIYKYSKDFAGEEKDITVMNMLGISRATYFKYKKEVKTEL